MSRSVNKPDPAALREEFWRLPDDAILDRPTIAAVIYLSVASMEALAIKGGGPKYTRINRRALYRKRDVLEWAAATGRTVQNTAQLHQQAACADAGRGARMGDGKNEAPAVAAA